MKYVPGSWSGTVGFDEAIDEWIFAQENWEITRTIMTLNAFLIISTV